MVFVDEEKKLDASVITYVVGQLYVISYPVFPTLVLYGTNIHLNSCPDSAGHLSTTNLPAFVFA